MGRPLDAPNEASDLLPTTLNLVTDVDGLLISHPHQDHCGLWEETSPRLAGILWRGDQAIDSTDVGEFRQANLLIEVQEKRILYSGDFRTHGRKAALVEHFMAAPPQEIDVLDKRVVMVRPSLMRDYVKSGVEPNDSVI